MAQMVKYITFGKQHVTKYQTHGDGVHGVPGILLVVAFHWL